MSNGKIIYLALFVSLFFMLSNVEAYKAKIGPLSQSTPKCFTDSKNIKKLYSAFVLKEINTNKNLSVLELEDFLPIKDYKKFKAYKGSLLVNWDMGENACNGKQVTLKCYYGGLILLGGIDLDYILTGKFKPTLNGLKPGLKKSEIKEKLGIPYQEDENTLVYAFKEKISPENKKKSENEQCYDAVRIFLKNGKLEAIWILVKRKC